ncbi:hypothetical protein BDZ88DRAFT_457087, partial [Geranomyces variabilis]
MSQLPESPSAAAASPLPPPPASADHQQHTDSLHIHANNPSPHSENVITAVAAAAVAAAAAAAAAAAGRTPTAPAGDAHHGDRHHEQHNHQERPDPLPEAPASTMALPSIAAAPSHHLSPQQQQQQHHPRVANHPPGTHGEGSNGSAAQPLPHRPHSPHQQQRILGEQQAAQVLHEKALAQQLHGQTTFGIPYAGATGTQSLAPGAAYRGNTGTTLASSSAQEAPQQQQQQPQQQDSQQQQQQQPLPPQLQQSQQLPSLQQAQNPPQLQNESQGQQSHQDQQGQAAANRDPPSSPTQYGTNSNTNTNALPGQPESWQEAAPYWRPTTQSCAMYNMDRTKTYELKLNPRVERGFFVADGDWTCYRRNYFQVSLGFSATDQVGQRAELPSLIAADGRLQTATAFYVGVAARTSNGQRVVELVQHTTKRDKGPQLVPEPRMCQPQDSPSALDTFHTVTFDRLQFKAATANNGKRRAAQQYHVLIAELFAEFPDHTRCRVAFAESAPLVVRGRAPGHYANMIARPPRTVSAAPPPNYYGNNTHGQGPPPPASDQHLGEQHAQGLPPLPQHLHPLHPLAGPHEHSTNVSLPQPNVHHPQQHQQQQQHQPQVAQVKTSAHPPSSHLASFHPHHPSVMYSQPASPAALGPDAAQQYFHHQQQLHGQQQQQQQQQQPHFQQYPYLPPHLLAQQQQHQHLQLRASPLAGNGGALSGTSTPHSHVSSHQQQHQPQTVYHDHAAYEHPHHPQHAASSSPAHPIHQQHPVQHPQQQQQQHHQQYQPHQQPSHFATSAQQHQTQVPQHQTHQHQGPHQGSSSLPHSRGGGGGGGGGG